MNTEYRIKVETLADAVKDWRADLLGPIPPAEAERKLDEIRQRLAAIEHTLRAMLRDAPRLR